MSNLTESMASDLACQIVEEDFNRPPGERLVFKHVDRYNVPGQVLDIREALPGKVSNMGHRTHSLRASVTTVNGPTRVRVDVVVPVKLGKRARARVDAPRA